MLKTITAALAADTTLLTITDAAINDSSIIEVYTDDDDLFPKSISQTGNTLSIIFDEQITVHAVKILVNNLSGEFIPFSGDYNDLSNKPSIPDIDVIPLLEEGEHIADIDLNGETYSLYAPAGSSVEISAEDVSYDNSVSGMLAENVQNAIDELNEQKQPLLTAGDGIDITDNVISATGGGSVSMDDIYPSDHNIEHEIGTDLYIKHFHGTLTTEYQTVDNTFDWRTVEIINIYGVFRSASGLVNSLGYLSNDWRGIVHREASGNILFITGGQSRGTYDVYVIYRKEV